MSPLTLTAPRPARRTTIRRREDKPVRAERMLRDIAFVLALTQRVKAQTLEGRFTATH